MNAQRPLRRSTRNPTQRRHQTIQHGNTLSPSVVLEMKGPNGERILIHREAYALGGH